MDTMDFSLSEDDSENVPKALDPLDTSFTGNSEDEAKMLESDVEIAEKESENSDSEDETMNDREAKNLEATLVENPYDYATHVALINVYRKMGELEHLRKARENMSAKFPLNGDLWLAWLQDEIKLAESKEQKEEIVKLCEQAVDDYLSVEVWLEYLQFNIGLMLRDENGHEKIRQLFERALTAAGLHVTKGAIIWEAFREFELVLLSSVDSAKGTQYQEQLDRVGNLYRRQLSCPLLNMEKTYEEYETWRKADGANSRLDDKNVRDGYNIALEKLKARMPFEDKLLSVQSFESELTDAYNGYLNFEKQNGDPARVMLLYDRALADVSLDSALWYNYISYVESNIKIEDILEKLFKKATRNVPWYSKIWHTWMRCYEKWGKSILDVQGVLENALIVEFQTPEDYRSIWMTYLEFLRRRMDQSSESEQEILEILRNAFNKACEHLAKYFGMNGDPSCTILQYWARVEALYAKDMEKVRSLWSDILSLGHSTTAASWLKYADLERCYGDTKHLRKLFQKALTSVIDWPESIATAWTDFERDEGTLQQMEHCESKVKERLEKVAEERKKTQEAKETPSSLPPSTLKKGTKRKVDESGLWKNFGASSQKLQKFERGQALEKKKVEICDVGSKPKIAPPPGYRDPENDEKIEEDVSDHVDNEVTVFVSNLDYAATEEEVEEALQAVGPITLVKMIKDHKGRSKGYCYVQLSSKEAVEEALKLDRTPVKGRPMFISRCNASKVGRPTAFKYKCSLEKNKLFIKGLPLTTTKEEIEEIFRAQGTLKEVRLVTFRNGHSKGLAYVEFENEADAAKALLATDGMKIQDKIISVAISKPPERKRNPEEPETHGIKSLGGSSSSRTTFGVPKTVLSMVPRNVKINTENGASGTTAKQPMSNQDFRKMLLKK